MNPFSNEHLRGLCFAKHPLRNAGLDKHGDLLPTPSPVSSEAAVINAIIVVINVIIFVIKVIIVVPCQWMRQS